MVQLADQTSNELTHQVIKTLQQQRSFFTTGQTKPIEFRIAQLQRLRQMVVDHKAEILAALKADLRKPEYEAYAAEIGVVREIDYAIKNLRSWMKPVRVKAPIDQWPAQAYFQPEPLGVVLIIGPWNYPFQLMLAPLVGAIAAGNCAILKPSELAAQTSHLLTALIKEYFNPAYITSIEGDASVSQALLSQKFDHIFFTGGTAIGKIVMMAAAQHLTPVTLELGGKSPCIVHDDVQLDYTAKRIAWGKFLNAGQSCIAPDYLLVNRRIKSALVDALKAAVHDFYGDDPTSNEDYGRIISDRQFTRLASLLKDGTPVFGGQTNADDRYIAPTLLDHISADAPIMQEEIFGPILPIIEYDKLEEAIDFINQRPKPLALYLFTRSEAIQNLVLQSTTSGGVCLNDTFMQVAVTELPFGGVGDSGIGSYHGKASFDTFSHRRSVLKKTFWFDPGWRYAPYKEKLAMLKKMIG